MISSIQGTLEAIGPDWVDVSVGGVTLRVNVPGSMVDQLGPRGSGVRMFTHLQVREDSLTLFGFVTEEARLTFETLLGINGVGPRLALAVLSRFAPDSLAAAVDSEDTDALSSVPGVGKKTASRILLELRGKLSLDWAGAASPERRELVDALTALGYTTSEAQTAASSVPSEDSMSLEDRLRMALQRMGAG